MSKPKSLQTIEIELAIAAAVTISVGTTVPAFAQDGSHPTQHIILVDPTPRALDPHMVFRDDPAERARQQQAAALVVAQRRTQALVATDQMVALAKELKEEVRTPNPASSMALNARKAEKIEKLAKTVREKMKN